jgi:1,4-dihydroxy-2-naphthoate polyprenyltransferase
MNSANSASADAAAMSPAVPAVHPPQGSLGAWILALRPATLPLAVAPVLVGGAICHHAGGAARPLALVAAGLGAMLLQIGANLANDVFDYEKGADTEERLGPTRVTQAGLLSPRAVKTGMAVTFALALAVGSYLIAVSGWPIVAIGVTSILAAIAYTGGPYPLGYNGLGDVFVFGFFGFAAVCGTTLVGLDAVPPLAVLASLPVGALATAVLVVNNVRDHETDVRAGKRTLVVRWGRRFGVVEYVSLLLLAYATPIVTTVLHRTGPLALLPLLTAPLGVVLARALHRERGRDLNPRLAGTAKLALLFSVLFAIGVAFG